MRLRRHRSSPADDALVVLRSVCHELRPPMATLSALMRAIEDQPAGERRTALTRLAAEHAAHAQSVLSEAAALAAGLTAHPSPPDRAWTVPSPSEPATPAERLGPCRPKARRQGGAEAPADQVGDAGAPADQVGDAGAPADRLGRGGPLHEVLPSVVATVPGGRLTVEVGREARRWPVHQQHTRQILINLVGNAAHHSGGAIRVGARLGMRRLRLTVTDEGRPGDDLWRAMHRRSAPTDNKGLGLWVVRHLTAMHGGTVRARPVRPVGLVMEVFLPRYRD